MSNTLEAILRAIEDGDESEAARILVEDDLAGLGPEDLDQLVRLALGEHEAHEYYSNVVSRVSPEVQMELAKDLGTHSSSDDVKDIVEKETSAERLDAIVRAYIKQDEDLGALYFAVIDRLSPDMQAAYNAAIGASSDTDYDALAGIFEKYPQHSSAIVEAYIKEVARDEIAELIKEAGALLSDDLLLKLARAMCEPKE